MAFGTFDLEKLLRHPRKGDPLLPSPAPLDRYCGNPADACAFGYRRAAEVLVEYTRPRGDEIFMFYPILFLYRHHIELMLKNLIFAFNEPGVRRVTGAEEFSVDERESLVKGKKAHSLKVLWERLRPGIRALGKNVELAENIEGINSYIQQLNEIDPGSESFRYTTAIEETKAKLKKVQKQGAEVNIQTFAEAMERLANYLDGLDSYVGAIIETHNETVAEFHDFSY